MNDILKLTLGEKQIFCQSFALDGVKLCCPALTFNFRRLLFMIRFLHSAISSKGGDVFGAIEIVITI